MIWEKKEKWQRDKRKYVAVLLAMLPVVVITSCGKRMDLGNNTSGITAEPATTIEAQAASETTETPGIAETPEITDSLETTMSQITIYYGDKACEKLLAKTVDVTKVDASVILSELEKAQVIQEGIEVLTMQTKEVKGRSILYLDFNQEFQKQLETYGSTGEQIFTGAVVNTFLDAMSAERVKITVEGETPITGHMVYDSPMKKFALSE